MDKVLIFSGTTEGRELSEWLWKQGVNCEACVATEYGEMVMPQDSGMKIRQGRLSENEMEELMKKEQYLVVVDATHPFATEVTSHIMQSTKNTSTPYVRLRREEGKHSEEKGGNIRYFDSALECAKALSETSGNILLTTGSKELSVFCQDDTIKERLVVRVLPGLESIQICKDMGIGGKQLIAMQGPFSKEMNLAMIHQYQIQCLVTKESGKNSGTDEKLEACSDAGIPVYMIRRPSEEGEGLSLEQTMERVLMLWQNRENKEIRNKPSFHIVLAGIGMGALENLSVALTKQLAKTDVLFGAKRMIDTFPSIKERYPFYLGKDILPKLSEMEKEYDKAVEVTILFSGDTGFYSGCGKLFEQLQQVYPGQIEIWPGTSSLSAFAAKVGLPWQDMAIVSTHGTEENQWKTQILWNVRRGKNIFFLSSGAEDVRKIGALLEEYEEAENAKIYLGYQLSYEEEKIMTLSVKECGEVTEKGLYVGIICPEVRENSGKLTPGLRDEEFLRDKVPMTKEEVREISLCKLCLAENAVLYDIGSGTGSIAVEAALLSPNIHVYAVENNPVALELIQRNAEKHGVFNVNPICALAPEGLDNLPVATHAFIGGSKGKLREILQFLYNQNPHMHIVMNAVSMESVVEMQTLLSDFSVRDVDVALVNVSKIKEVGSYHMMQANNPVYVFSFCFC